MQVLVVDDQGAVRTALQLLFELHGIECITASSPRDAVRLVRSEDIGVVVADMNFATQTTSGDEGIALFRELKALDADLPVILLTAWTSLETAVTLVKEGAADYMAKPWDDRKLVLSVQNLLSLHAARRENIRLRGHDARAREELSRRFDLRGLVYCSRAMHEALSLAVRVAPSEAPILISGPNGSGKERLAEIIQANSRRAAQPFVRVNAGGLPDQLLEAELFGAEPGAFTGATKLRIGRFEAADGGTLFLDELGNLSPSGQMKLLRVLQSGEFQRLGSNTNRKVDVRLISATNADLKAEIGAGRFREDLYFRLNVIEVELPSLAQRSDDIRPLASAFLSNHVSDKPRSFAPDALNALEQHDWPGNVRELENRIQRAVLVSSSQLISALDLGLTSDASRTSSAPAALEQTGEQVAALGPTKREQLPAHSPAAERGNSALADAEYGVVESALAAANGVVARAAAELGVSRQSLYRRMTRLGISIERSVR